MHAHRGTSNTRVLTQNVLFQKKVLRVLAELKNAIEITRLALYRSKVLLDGSKTLQAAQKRDYNDEDEFLHTSTHSSHPVKCLCTACER